MRATRLRPIAALTAIAIAAAPLAAVAPTHAFEHVPAPPALVLVDDEFSMPTGATAIIDVLSNDEGFGQGLSDVLVRVVEAPHGVKAAFSHEDVPRLSVQVGPDFGSGTVQIVYEVQRENLWPQVERATVALDIVDVGGPAQVSPSKPWSSAPLAGPGSKITIDSVRPLPDSVTADTGTLSVSVTADNRIRLSVMHGAIFLGEAIYTIRSSAGVSMGSIPVTVGYDEFFDRVEMIARDDRYVVTAGQWHMLPFLSNDSVNPEDQTVIDQRVKLAQGVRYSLTRTASFASA